MKRKVCIYRELKVSSFLDPALEYVHVDLTKRQAQFILDYAWLRLNYKRDLLTTLAFLRERYQLLPEQQDWVLVRKIYEELESEDPS